MRRVAVCIKQIPVVNDANFDPVTKTIRRDGINIIGAYDLTAIAEAVALKRQFGADTTVVTMGPPQARSALADSLAMGIDRAVHLEDRDRRGTALVPGVHRLPFGAEHGLRRAVNDVTGDVESVDRHVDEEHMVDRLAEAAEMRREEKSQWMLVGRPRAPESRNRLMRRTVAR